MDKIRLLLTVITIAIVVIPIVGMLLAYQNNLLGLFVPPEITELADDFMGGDGDNGSVLEPTHFLLTSPSTRYLETLSAMSTIFLWVLQA